MNVSHKPRPTRSTLQNKRLVRALRTQNWQGGSGLRANARRHELPAARKTEIALAAAATAILLLSLIGLSW